MRFRQPGQGPSIGFYFSMTPAVKALLIANAALFILDLVPALSRIFDEQLALRPRAVLGSYKIWQLATYMFLHDGFWHLALNLLPLWMFGTRLERTWGLRTFLTFYFLSGIGGGICYLLINWNSLSLVVGASGAVCGVLMAFAVLFPEQIVYFFGIFPIKIKWLVTGYVVMTLVGLASAGGNIAHSAHLGGMIFGWIYLRGFRLPAGGLNGFKRAWHRRRMRSKMRVVDPPRERGGNGKTKSGPGSGPARSEIDRILDKITSTGLDSLTDEEQEILRRAGKKKH